jgi:8-oxo-dGTP pyrophosphatase MutT (NUDIX family)
MALRSPEVGCDDMSKVHRIAAGGLIFRNDAVLLVRYRNDNGGTYLVAPGGELEEDENVVQAIIRETMEETNIRVQPKRVVLIEDLICASFKMIKVWLVCDVVAGEISQTKGAEMEGIIEAAWYEKAQLAGEVVFPPPLIQHNWDQLRSENWQVECLPTRRAVF